MFLSYIISKHIEKIFYNIFIGCFDKSSMYSEYRKCLRDGKQDEVLNFLKQYDINKSYEDLGCVNLFDLFFRK